MMTKKDGGLKKGWKRKKKRTRTKRKEQKRKKQRKRVWIKNEAKSAEFELEYAEQKFLLCAGKKREEKKKEKKKRLNLKEEQ
jgi:hypothetical protein